MSNECSLSLSLSAWLKDSVLSLVVMEYCAYLDKLYLNISQSMNMPVVIFLICGFYALDLFCLIFSNFCAQNVDSEIMTLPAQCTVGRSLIDHAKLE